MTHSELFRSVASLEGIINDDFRNELLAFIEGHQEEAKQLVESIEEAPPTGYISIEDVLETMIDWGHLVVMGAGKKFDMPNDTAEFVTDYIRNGKIKCYNSIEKQPAPDAELFAVPDMIRTIIREYEVAHDKAKAVADKALNFYNKEHGNSKP